MDWGAASTELLLALVPLFVVVDPLASIGLFLGLTARHDRRARDRVALRATLFAGIVLLGFAVAGRAILLYLGIQLYSLQVAGGILLTLIGLNMLKEGEEVPVQEIASVEQIDVATGGSHSTGAVGHDPSLVPLGLPMLAGPGAISLVIVQTTRIPLAAIAPAIVLAMAASLVILLVTARAANVLGENARRVITRIMGLLTVAFAVQYVFDGINGWMRPA
jgi:multiple antibiotic resistance protein